MKQIVFGTTWFSMPLLGRIFIFILKKACLWKTFCFLPVCRRCKICCGTLKMFTSKVRFEHRKTLSFMHILSQMLKSNELRRIRREFFIRVWVRILYFLQKMLNPLHRPWINQTQQEKLLDGAQWHCIQLTSNPKDCSIGRCIEGDPQTELYQLHKLRSWCC